MALRERQTPAPRSSLPRVKGRSADSGADLTLEERVERGRQARQSLPLTAHAELIAPSDRRDPVALLEEQSLDRQPELIPERYSRMSESPFRFYRGAAALMAADLAAGPTTGLRAQLCGDAHMLNFRLLASPERRLIFDINDFDETLPGPWEWDVKRLATSLVIAGRANGLGPGKRRDVVVQAVKSYRDWMGRFAGMDTLDVWNYQPDTAQLAAAVAPNLSAGNRKRLDATLRAARRRDNRQAVRKLTVVVAGRRRIAADPPLLIPLRDMSQASGRADLERGLADLMTLYAQSLNADRKTLIEQYHIVDLAHKVVGVGSVGTRCWIVLMGGRTDDDALLLQVKEASASALQPYAGPSAFAHQGQRVVTGQRLMQASGDSLLGWIRSTGVDGQARDFYVRQLRDWKGIAVPEKMKPSGLRWFGAISGKTLARAHAKSGDRVAIAAYLGRKDTFDKALAAFAEAYADRNEDDYQRLLEAIAIGRVTAEPTLAIQASS
ncbi:MAG: hypothetical protein JWN96_1037 [Mycobacterium sp.]|nr:hypothetical protein [Mycobacterium sp.]